MRFRTVDARKINPVDPGARLAQRSSMNERRYTDDEIREIFELAATAGLPGGPGQPGSDGLTLAAIQDIGREVGLAPDLVARAAASLDARPARRLRTSWGVPIEVGRVVPLPRPLTDREWARLVAELRSTFGARGRVSEQGGIREWANGKLHACVEPDDHGYRLRLGTLKSDAAGINALGITGLAAGALTLVSFLLSGEPQAAVFVPTLFAGAGAAALLANRVRLPRWARLRERQMEQIAVTAVAMTGDTPMAAREP
jgi:hypothetical protein